MFLIVTKYLIPKGYSGMAFFPFVFVKHSVDRQNDTFLNHEKIHLRQQIEMLVLPYYIWYLLEFCLRWIQYRNFDLAYRNISFEREAYANERNLDYLKRRKFWAFLRNQR